MIKKIFFAAKITVILLAVFLSAAANAEWADVPTGVTTNNCPPTVPGCNTPLNVGPFTQVKTGELDLGANLLPAPLATLMTTALSVGVPRNDTYTYRYSVVSGGNEVAVSAESLPVYISPGTGAGLVSLTLTGIPLSSVSGVNMATVRIYRKALSDNTWRIIIPSQAVVSSSMATSDSFTGGPVGNPTAGSLAVNGVFKLPAGSGDKKILASNALGVGSWISTSTLLSWLNINNTNNTGGNFWQKKSTTAGAGTIVNTIDATDVEIVGRTPYLPGLVVKGSSVGGSAAEFIGSLTSGAIGSAGIYTHAEGLNGVGIAAIGGNTAQANDEGYGAKLISGKFGAYLKGKIGLYSADMNHAAIQSNSGRDNKAPAALVSTTRQYAGYFDGDLISTGKVGAGTETPTAILEATQTSYNDALGGQPVFKFTGASNMVRGEFGKWSGGALLYSDYPGGVGVAGTVTSGARDGNQAPPTAIMGMANALGGYSGRFLGYDGVYTRGDRFGLYATNQLGGVEPPTAWLATVNKTDGTQKSYVGYFADTFKNANSYAGYFDGRLATNNHLDVGGHIYLGLPTATDGSDLILQNMSGNYNIDNYNGTLRFHSAGLVRFAFSQDGKIKINGGAPGLNKVLASTDAEGNAVWKTIQEICPGCSTATSPNYWTLNGSNLSNNSGNSLTLNIGGGNNAVNINASAGYAYLRLSDPSGNTSISNSGSSLNIGGDSGGGSIYLRTNGYNNAMVIGASGNVGIGTNNPQSKLEISGGVIVGRSSVDDGDNLVIQSGSGQYILDNVGGSLRFYNPNVSAYGRPAGFVPLEIKPNGQLLIRGGNTAPGEGKILTSTDNSGGASWCRVCIRTYDTDDSQYSPWSCTKGTGDAGASDLTGFNNSVSIEKIQVKMQCD